MFAIMSAVFAGVIPESIAPSQRHRFDPWWFCALSLLCAWPAFSQPRLSNAPPRPNLTTFTPDSLPVLVSHLIATGGTSLKSEFETSEHFDAQQTALLKANDRRYIFVKDPNEEDFSYDADTSTLNFQLLPYTRRLLGDARGWPHPVITLASIRTSSREYMGTNAFGVKMLIRSSEYANYEVALSEDSAYGFAPISSGSFPGSYPSDYKPIRGSFAMPMHVARNVKPFVRFAFYGRLSQPRVYIDTDFKEAKINDPYEVRIKRHVILFRVEALVIIDVRSGSIISADVGAQ